MSDLVCEFAPCPLASPANPEDPEDLLEGAQTSSMTVSFTPGAGFDPRSRVFSPEELKPHPIVKKRGKVSENPCKAAFKSDKQEIGVQLYIFQVFVPNEKKDNLYWTRRLKNNVAAKRSREARRLKENQIALRAAFLERENTDLRVTVAELSRKNQVAVAEVRRLAQRLKMLEENEVRYQRRLLA